jgi:hypothetical protein
MTEEETGTYRAQDHNHWLTNDQVEFQKRNQLCIATIKNPSELWFYWEKDSRGEISYYHRYICSFVERDDCEPEIIAVTAFMKAPGEFQITSIDSFWKSEFDDNSWRCGLLIYIKEKEENDDRTIGITGVCWSESMICEFDNTGQFLVRDIAGDVYCFNDFPWTEEQVHRMMDYQMEQSKYKKIEEGMKRCTTDPDIIVQRPSLHPESGLIINMLIYYRAYIPPGKKRPIHHFTLSELKEDNNTEIIDFMEIPKKKDREDMLFGIAVYRREFGSMPRYILDEKGYRNPDTGELTDTETRLRRFKHPKNPEKTIWCAVVVKLPKSDPPDIIDIQFIDNKNMLNKIRNGKLIYTDN